MPEKCECFVIFEAAFQQEKREHCKVLSASPFAFCFAGSEETGKGFSMYGGEQRLVKIRFVNPLLDAVAERFGTKDVQYAKVDETHFSVTAKVEISDQFFG